MYRGLLPHLTWGGARSLESGGDYWRVTAEPAVLDRGRLVHAYRLEPMGDPRGEGEPSPTAPRPGAYADEVMDGVRREWDELNLGFVVAHQPPVRGAAGARLRSPRRARGRAARDAVTAGAGALAALYVLSFLPGPPGDPIGPLLGALAVALLVDAARRYWATRRGRYAPSLLRFAIPTDLLRPERVAYHAHRDAERRILDRAPSISLSPARCVQKLHNS